MKPLRPVPLAVSLALGAVAVLVFLTGGRMFSPGALRADNRTGKDVGGVQAHANLSGSCSACHAPFWSGSRMADRCLSCHADIHQQISDRDPLHGKLTNAMACVTCHTEHRGPHAALTDWKKFDHDCTAFSLTGKHTLLECAACHKSDRRHGYKGVAQTCAGCHAEPKSHEGKFGTHCASCHSTITWNQTNLAIGPAGFDHDRTAFKLTGKHLTTECRACHSGGTFKGTSTTCVSCHAEPPAPKFHHARYGTDCARCHNTLSFTGSTFKHSFPVDHHSRGGKGSKVVSGNLCANCHNNAENFVQYTCTNCHAHELTRMQKRHSKRLLGDIELEQCAKCHPKGRERERRAAFDNVDPWILVEKLILAPTRRVSEEVPR